MRQENGPDPERRDAGVEHDARGDSQGGEDTAPNPVTGAVCQHVQHVLTRRDVHPDPVAIRLRREPLISVG